MKKMKKIVALLIAMVMVLGMSTAVFAQTVHVTDSATNTGKIVISNAAKGETYGVIKLFSATVNADGSSIAYTGDIPSSLSTYFSKDTAGNITATDAAWNDAKTDMSEGLRAALQTWAEGQTAIKEVESDGSELTFDQLEFGYYVVTTTQGEDKLISVDSTNPTANIIDKNMTPPVSNPTKTANDKDVFIGQTVTYTVSFKTANYDGTKQITKYTIADNFANGVLTNVKVNSVKVGGTDIGTTTEGNYSPQFDADGKIEIAWINADGNSLYNNGATIEITYEATVAASAAIDGAGNTNSVTITYTTDEDHEYEVPVTDTIFTYAIALKKVDQAGNALADAKFQLPFYVNATAASDGAYVYAGTTAGDGLVNELTTPASGLIIVKGVATGEYSITETEAPKGYNKLTTPVKVTATKTGATTTSSTTYYDKDGNEVGKDDPKVDHTVIVSIEDLAATPVVVVNKTGAELPSTGGMGTTIFYIIGAILVVGAGVILVSRRRMNKD